MADYQTGKLGKVTSEGTDLPVTSWSLDAAVDEIDATSTAEAGYNQSEGGVQKASGTVEINWDADTMPHSNPPNINEGQVVALVLYVGDPANLKYWSIPTALITRVNTRSAVRDKVSISFDFASRGAYSPPA